MKGLASPALVRTAGGTPASSGKTTGEPGVASTSVIWDVLDGVMDPEVPVLSVVELGIVRDVEVEESGAVTVTVTPTYSGCPAMQAIQADIRSALSAAGWRDVHIRTVYAPAWTTDWIGEEARRKLRDFGIAPPPPRGDDSRELVPLRRAVPTIACPYCGSSATTTRSEFGPTACKAVMYCEHCRQPFELFKAL